MNFKRLSLCLFLFGFVFLGDCSSGITTEMNPTIAPTQLSQTPTSTIEPTDDPVQIALTTATLAPNEILVTSVEELSGIWDSRFQINTDAVLRFEMDGTYELAETISQLDLIPLVKGRYSFDGIHMYASDNKCQEGEYEVRITSKNGEPRSLKLIEINDPCSTRARDWRREMTEVLP